MRAKKGTSVVRVAALLCAAGLVFATPVWGDTADPANADSADRANADSANPSKAGAANADPVGAAKKPWQVRLLGEQIVPKGLVVDGMPVGELSGIDYDKRSDQWYLVSDDTSEATARFYTASLGLDEEGLHSVDLESGTAILRHDGSEFPSWDTDDPEVADPESIRYDEFSHTFWWSSEGKRDPESGHQLVDPWVRQMTPSGKFVRETYQPMEFQMSASEVGPQGNGVFEGLTLSASGRELVTAMEAPLYQDGDRINRITFYDKLFGFPIRQVAYETDDIEANGVSEILAISDSRYLVLERNYVPELGNSIRVHEIDLRGATNVLGRHSLADGKFRPVRKRLVVDFATLGLDKVDNIEAMTWGPRLDTGERTLVFVSDDGFNDTQITQVVALAVDR